MKGEKLNVMKKNKILSSLLSVIIIFAMLFGAFQLYRQIKASKDPEHSEAKIEERYQEAMREYEKQVKDIEDSIEDNEKAKADNRQDFYHLL